MRDVLDEGEIMDEDSVGLDISQVIDGESLAPFDLPMPREIPTVEKRDVTSIFENEPEQKVFEAEGEVNQSGVWASKLNKKAVPMQGMKKKEETKVQMPKLNAKKTFTMRNPRKSLNRSMSKTSSSSSFNFSQGNEEVLPDLETILIEKAKRHDIENVPKNANLPVKGPNPINSVDVGWLNRRDSSNNVPIDTPGSSASYGLGNAPVALLPKQSQTSFGMSALKINSGLSLPNPEPVQVAHEDKKYHESDDSDAVVPNSDDESTRKATERRQSLRHVMKRRRLNESLSQKSVPVPTEPQPEVQLEKPKTPPKKSPKQKTPVKAVQRTPTRRSTRTKRGQIAYQPIIESEEEPDPFACDDDSDKDPPFKSLKEEKEIKTRKKRELTKEKVEKPIKVSNIKSFRESMRF